MELLHPPNCGGSNLLTAQKNISPKAKRELFPHFSLKNLVFLWLRDKRKCCLPSGGFVHTGPACECRQEAPVCSSPIHLLTTAAGTICYTQEHKYTNTEVHQYKNTKTNKNTKYFIITAKMSHYAHQSTFQYILTTAADTNTQIQSTTNSTHRRKDTTNRNTNINTVLEKDELKVLVPVE